MKKLSAIILVLFGGFTIMVLEIIGARFLAKDFGSSFYVWISQIGVIMIALALGYYIGGALADRFQKAGFLFFLLIPAGIYTGLIPVFAQRLIDPIIMRHPLEKPIPLIWQKLDPAIGSAIFFFLPCFVLAILSPYMIRIAASKLTHVGRITGIVYAFSTLGSIAGVFVSGYVLIDHFKISEIIYGSGVLMILLGFLTLWLDFLFRTQPRQKD